MQTVSGFLKYADRVKNQNGGRRDYLPCVRRLNICGGDHQLWDLSPLVSNLFSGSIYSLQVPFQLCRRHTHWWLRGQRGCPLLLSKVCKRNSSTNWKKCYSTKFAIFCIFLQLQWARKESQEGKKAAAAVAAANQPGCWFCSCWKISKAAVLLIPATAKSGFWSLWEIRSIEVFSIRSLEANWRWIEEVRRRKQWGKTLTWEMPPQRCFCYFPLWRMSDKTMMTSTDVIF